MFYMLECWGLEGENPAELAKVSEFEDVSWISGAIIKEAVPTPVLAEVDGEPDDVLVPIFDAGAFLLRDDVIQAMEVAGVDNLQQFDAVVLDLRTGEKHLNYKAVNIIGLVAAADLSESNYRAHGTPVVDVDFDGLAIDAGKAHSLLVFRLAECVTGVVVHERVKNQIEASGITGLDFIDPSDWAG